MPGILTATELANELKVNPRRLRRWLRAQKAAGHPLLGGHLTSARWEFSRQDADRLIADFRSSELNPHVSDSAVQRKAELVIRERLAERLGVALSPRTVRLAAGAPVQVDASSPDGTVLAEIFARQGELKGGQQKKVAIDTLKLITIRRERPDTRVILAFADNDAAAYATGGGWVAQALRSWQVDVEVVDIPEQLRNEIRAAQAVQTMVNPDVSTEADDALI
jgi:hypothetical protein